MKKNHPTPADHPSDFVFGVLVGALAGAGAMLLLAPQSGQGTRAKLQRESSFLREQVADVLDEVVAQTRVQARQLVDTVRGKPHAIQHAPPEPLTALQARQARQVRSK